MRTGPLQLAPVALTEEQRQIVEADADARILVLAGPGTGKTEILARRLLYLLESGLKPSQVLVLSFSRNAVRNVTKRVHRLSDVNDLVLSELRHLTVRTFDSWAFRVLRKSGESAEDLLRCSYENNIAKLVGKLKSNQSKVVLERLSHIRHIIVDELQDLGGWRGELVMELLEKLCPPNNKKGGNGFTLLGDPAQSIYNFSLRTEGENANSCTPEMLLRNIKGAYTKELAVKSLTANFRSEQEIAKTVDSARSILLSSKSAEQKLESLRKLVAASASTELEQFTAPVDGSSPNRTLAILCRTNGQALSIADKLYGHSDDPPPTPIIVAAGSPSRSVPAWIAGTLGRFSADNLTKSSFSKIYKMLYGNDQDRSYDFGIPDLDSAWDLLKREAASNHGHDSIQVSKLRERLNWPDLLPDDEGVRASTINVTTIHQSKGLEYDGVSVLETSNGSPNGVRDAGESDEVGLLEEANVLFVALSRAGKTFGRLTDDAKGFLSSRKFGRDDHTRWCSWYWGGCKVEVGLKGDVAPESFVSADLFDSSEKVGQSQAWLAKNSDNIRGHKVVLVKSKMPGSDTKFVYDVHLQRDSKPAERLGRTRPQLTYDLLNVFKIFGGKKKFALPGRIFNLRVADVISMSGTGEELDKVYDPWKKSGLWIGVRIHGLGFFKKTKAR